MGDRRRYKITDYRFGQLALTLRERAGLTQSEVAEIVGVSDRTIQHWEGGTAFPASSNLQKLIALFLDRGAFPAGHERDEAAALWLQADESAARRKSLFDDAWFELLLQAPQGEEVSRSNSTSETDDAIRSRSIDWDEAPDVSAVFGREHELDTLRDWVLQDRCRVVAILGLGGIGKTTLVTRFGQDVASHFDSVVWRSLRDTPTLHDLLVSCVHILRDQQSAPPPLTVDASAKLLIDLLQEKRCLVILDDLDSLLEPGDLAGNYRGGYENYRRFFQRVAQTAHGSCILLTSREMLSELEPLVGSHASVRSLKLPGLDEDASRELVADKQLFGKADDWGVLVQHYSGNPLALKIAGSAIHDLFGGDISAAVAAYSASVSVGERTLARLLDEQFGRLSPFEQAVMCWLAIEREPTGLETLAADLAGTMPPVDLLTILRSLLRRSLVERGDRGAIFTLQPEVMDYVSGRLVDRLSDALVTANISGIAAYALLKNQSKDYVRDNQMRTIVQQVLARLVAHFGDEVSVERHLLCLMAALREQPVAGHGYAGGNILNLLVRLRGNLQGVDCSGLVLREVDLRGVNAQDSSFAGCDLGHALFTEPLETIASMALSRDGQFVAVGSFTGQIRVWKVEDGKPCWSTKGGTRMIWSLAFSPDGLMLASGDYAGEIRLWNVADGHNVRTFDGHTAWVRTVAFGPDGHTLASAGDDETVRVWNVEDGTCRHVMRGHTGLIWSAACSPDGRLLATGGSDGTVRFWNLEAGTLHHALQIRSTDMYAVAFHPDGRTCAIGGEDDFITIWDVSSGQLLETIRRQGTGLGSIAFNLEGTILASGNNEGAVELWEIGTERDCSAVRALQGHIRSVSSVAFAFGGLMASTSYGGQVKIWDVGSGRCLRTIQGHSTLITASAFSPDGKLLAQGDDNGAVRIWDTTSGRSLMSTHGHPGPVWTIAFSPDGETFASGGDDQEVKLWRIREGRCVMSLPGHSTVVWSVVFSPDGKRLASGGAERVIRLWDIESASNHESPIALMRSVHWIWSLAFSPDGTQLASGDTTGAVELWEIESCQLLRTMQHNHVPIGVLRFDRNGETLYTSSNHHILKQWDLGNGNCLKTVAEDTHDSWVKAVALGEDGKLVVTGSDDHSVQVWHVGRADESHTVTRFSGCEAQVWAVALSQDGSMIAGSDDHGMTVLWDAASGTVLKRLSCDRPYERMNIHGINGFNEAQRATLLALGAIATQEPAIRQPMSAVSGPTLVLLDADEGSDLRAKRIP